MPEERVNEEDLRRAMILKRMILRQGMSPEARERLARVKVANPELASRAEAVCLQLIQQGRKVDDELLKRILEKLNPKREIKIMRW